MAIGDPWDSSYDPRENGTSQYDWMLNQYGTHYISNHWTGRPQWGPDHSYLVPQDDPSTIHDRRSGRFCTEGCGCIKTDSSHPFKKNAATILPQELVIEVYKAKANETRKDILKKYHAQPYSAKQRINLAYADGAWRGRKQCSNDTLRDILLESPTDFDSKYPRFIDDPCKEQGTDCHFANNKFKNKNSDDPNDYLDSEDFTEFIGEIDEDGVWTFERVGFPTQQHYDENESATPRYLEDYYVKLRTDDQYFLDLDAAAAADGRTASFKGSIAYTDKNGNISAFQHTYNDGNYCTKYQFGNQEDCEAAGGEWLETPERNIFINKAKDGAPRLVLAEDGYIGLRDKNGPLNDGSKSDREIEHLPKYGSKGEIESVACVKDGFTPLKKRPYCRNSITGHRVEQECEELNLPSDSHKSKAGCTKYGTCTTVNGHVLEAGCTNAGGEWTPYKWLYGDEESCIESGVCEKPEDVINTNKKRSDNIVEGITDITECESKYGTRDAYCSDSDHATKEECEEAGETWNSNRFISNDFVDHEYDRRSCCGQHIVDQNHPFRTPQFTGAKTSADGVAVKDSNLENATCFTPYEEYVLLPPEVPAINLNDRDPLFQQDIQGKNSFWTLLIRPCKFWDSCFEQGAFVGDNKDGGYCRTEDNDIKPEYRNRKDCNYYGYIWASHNDNPFHTGCGEEIVLKIPTNQLLNDSNFNLTLTDYHSPKGDDIVFSESTKRNMSIEARNTNLRETQPSWDLKFGIFDRVYDWWNVTGPPPNTVLNPPSTLNGPFPADAMYEVIYDWWCNTPDSNYDGIADGADSHLREEQRFFCNNFVYSDSPDYRQSLNPKGGDTFAKFNLQPQPFKATEERQLRAKTIEQAKIDYSFWYDCVSRSWAGDAGHWFVNYGQDYFLYFDFEENKGDDDYEAHCDKISADFNEWIKTHIGHMSNGKCSDMGAIGWLNFESGAIGKDHPCGFEYFVDDSTGELTEAYGCGGFVESTCSAAGYCKYPDGTFDNTTDESNCTGQWVECCEYIETCIGPDGAEDAQIVTGVDPATTEYIYGKVAENKEECEAPLEGYNQDPPNPGAGGTWKEGCQNKSTGSAACGDLEDIPDELADIVFGEQHGTCEKEGEDPTSTSKETCENEDGEFTPDLIGHYKKRIGSYIKPAQNVGRLPSGYEDPYTIGSITNGVQDSSIIENAIDAELGDSPQYWHETGLYPIHETQVSFISDSCVGTKGSGKIQFASNENPIKITSPNHNLRDGDKVDIRGVLGNFPANVMTNKEWAETQWEGKKANMNFKGDEKISHPFAVCPCEPDGSLDTDKYYACYGQVVAGTNPEPAPFFIVKDATPDTFDLYTCDKRPIDGTITYGSGENCKEVIDPTIRWYSVYGHMDNITLKEGDIIEFGKELGTISDVGTDEGWNHLHFSMGEISEEDQFGNFGFGAVQGISFDTKFELESCFDDYSEERERTLNKALDAEKQALILESVSLNDLLSVLSAQNPGRYIRAKYSTTNTHDNYFGIDIQTHESETCDAETLVSESEHGYTVYNPVKDSSPDGEQIVTYVAKILPESGAVILQHEIIISATENEQSLDAYRSCPFTGKWETWLEPTTETMPGQTVSSPKIEYRPGWSGNSKKWLYRANDFYVAIEQKGVCPVCNDHYIPEKLNATLSTVSSEYLNVANCTINPCYEPNVCIDNTSPDSKGLDDFDILYGVRDFLCIEISSGEAVDKEQADCVAPDYEWKKDAAAAKEKCLQDENIWVGEDWWNYSVSEGYCCRDDYHLCEGSDGMTIEEEIADCKENPQNYGRCQKNHVTNPAYTPQQCQDVGGSFTDPLSSPDQCERFLRRRITVEGTTNCRRCSDVFTNENGVPLKDFVDERSGYYSASSGSWIKHTHMFEGTPLNKLGESCCGRKATTESPPEGNCDCIGNSEKYPTCEQFEFVHGECDSSKLGDVELGELKATCKEEIDESTCQNSNATFVWSPDFSGGGSWGLTDSCTDPECSEPPIPTQASHPPSDVNEFVELKLPCRGGKASYHWAFNPCSCFPNNIAAECEDDKIHATDRLGEESCEKQPDLSGKDDSGWYHDNSEVGLGCGKLGDSNVDNSTVNIGICYHQALSNQPIDSTCPGLSSILDIPMEYDGQVWRSEWSVMGDVGLHQCGLQYDTDETFGEFISPRNSQRWPFEGDCKPDLYDDQGNEIKTADYLVYTNADCNGCDMPQHSYAGVSTFGGLEYRNVELPTTDKDKTDRDRHFIRLILGCGDSIPSIEEGLVKDGGLGPSPQTYQSDSMKLWAEITNCAFHDNDTHGLLRERRVADGIDGNPPCFSDLGGCTEWEHFGKTIDQADTLKSSDREYMFAGQCVSHKACGPKGPCAEVECCQYEGRDVNRVTSEGPLWNGSVACSTGGHINNICQAIGFQMGPDKRQEVLTVYDIIDVNHLTGEGTLVAKSKGGTCSYAAGATVSIGMAGPREASSSSRDDYTRNKHAANPFLRGTVLTESIQTPKFQKFNEDGESIGYYSGDRAGEFIYIRVKDITPLINKNSRKDRHLKYNDIRYAAVDENFDEQVEAIDGSGKKVDSENTNPIVNEHDDFHTGLLSPKNIGLDDGSGSSMVANKGLKYPYGNSPYPVATQTISGTTKEQMWPKGKVMSPSNLESLRFASQDYANDIVVPGRTGKLWRDYDSGKFEPLHSIVPSSFFAKRKEVEITKITNVYDPIIGFCIDNKNYKEKDDCVSNGHIWLPKFLNTTVELPYDGYRDVQPINEKIVISGTVAYKATCKGSSLGYCYKFDGSGKGKNINECADSSQFDDGLAGQWVQAFTDAEADQSICEDVFGGKWVIGIRNPDTKNDPENNSPLDLPNRERDFEIGCPAGCQLKGFYTDKACIAFQDEVQPGDPPGECYECITDTFVNSNGETEDFLGCPLSPIDGSHLAVRHNFESYLDTIYLDGPLDLNTITKYSESFGEKIFSGSDDVFVLASEEHITVNDEAKIWSQDLDVKYSSDLDTIDKVKAQNANSTFDPSETRNFYTDLPKDECLSRTNTYYWDKIAYTSSNEITIEDTIDERLPVCIEFNRFEGAFFNTFSSDEREKQLQLQELISGSTLFSTQGYYDFLGDRFNMSSQRPITSSTITKPAGVYSYKQLSEACELSHNCHFERIPFECRGGDPKNDDGWCKTFTGNEDFVTIFPKAERTTKEECGSGSVFTPDISTSTDTYIANQGFLERHNEKECLEAGHEVIPIFLCYKENEEKDISQAQSGDNIGSFFSFLDTGKGNLGDDKTVLTPQECEAAGGSVFYDGIFNTASRQRIDTLGSFREMREYTKFNKDSRNYSSPYSKYKSRDFLLKGLPKFENATHRYINEFGKITYNWGLARTETAVSTSKRKWKGVIYAYEAKDNLHMNQKDKTDYSKYTVQDPENPVDTYLNFYNGGRAYWSRHGGAFDVTISQKLPENKARDNNSDKPVNLEFWLNFPQICCNLRGPANYWACPKDCWPTANGSEGPVLDFLEREYGIQGESLIHVNITEEVGIYKGGGGTKRR